jgi:hypothetical protein
MIPLISLALTAATRRCTDALISAASFELFIREQEEATQTMITVTAAKK